MLDDLPLFLSTSPSTVVRRLLLPDFCLRLSTGVLVPTMNFIKLSTDSLFSEMSERLPSYLEEEEEGEELTNMKSALEMLTDEFRRVFFLELALA